MDRFQVREKFGENQDRLLSSHATYAEAEKAIEDMGLAPRYLSRFVVDRNVNLVTDQADEQEMERMRKRREVLAAKDDLARAEMESVNLALDLRKRQEELKKAESFAQPVIEPVKAIEKKGK